MEWTDAGIVLSARRHGEHAAVVSLLTAHHGRHAGLVRGARGRRGRGLYQVGNTLSARWRARLAEHLGDYACEMARARAATLLDDPLRLAGLSAICGLAEATLPERQPYPRVYATLDHLLDTLEEHDHWPQTLVHWELMLLSELGFGLDLSACAATGTTEDLIYVSPRSGRALSREAGAPYAKKLLPLPPFLGAHDTPAAPTDEILAGLRLTGWFLEHHVFREQGGHMPAARDRFLERLAR
jgi:DNA repair protein RecO (recombination protein O)